MPDLNELAREHLEAALVDPRGRSAHLVAHDGELRQTVLALRAGATLGEHSSPPAATILVLRGRVRVLVGEDVQSEIAAGELWVLTHERHGVLAVEDSVFLLTTVTGVTTTPHR